MEFSISVWILLWTLVVTPLVYVIYHVIVFILDVRTRGLAVDKFPSDPKHWLWGHLHLFPGPNEAGLRSNLDRMSRYPRAHSFFATFLRPSVIVHHPDTMKMILKTSEPKPSGLGVYSYGKNWLGDGLLLSSGDRWARNRRLLTPAFHFDVLKPYVDVKNRAVEILIDKMLPYAASGESFEFYTNVSLLTFDIILRCAFSYENDVQTIGESHPYVHAVSLLSDLWMKRSLQPWLHFDFLYQLTSDGKAFKNACDYVHTVSEEVIEKRKKALLEENGKDTLKGGRYLDFLDILLTARDEEGIGLSDQDIRNEVDTFLFEGHDTTASAISWALFSLAENPEHQTLCQQEIDTILDGRSDETITWDDLSQLKYLTLCIKECLRLHCPIALIQRQTKNKIVIDDVTLPPRTVIGVHIYNLHHNPLIWEDPMEFRPSRFLPENIALKDHFAFLPFSAGPRNCIGQHFAMDEQKILLARILRRYTISLDPDFTVEKKMSIVMKTQNGMYMKIATRQPNIDYQ